ncbi:MAG: stage IV sporulation protein A [Lachnospiraceae bacterium]|nr:stage IV sporulation protein A [Lachnospiraceae bacterium]
MKNHELHTVRRLQNNGELSVGIAGPGGSGKSVFVEQLAKQMSVPAANGQIQNRMQFTFDEGHPIQIRLSISGKNSYKNSGENSDENTDVGGKLAAFDAGLVITADGSFGEKTRESYLAEEKEVILEMQKNNHPFVVIVNSEDPSSEKASAAAAWISSSYGVYTFSMNCQKADGADFRRVFELLFYEFPLLRLSFRIPRWVETLDNGHWLKQSLFESAKKTMAGIQKMRDVGKIPPAGFLTDNQYVKSTRVESINPGDGSAEVLVTFGDSLYYEILSEMTGEKICSEYQLISILREMSQKKEEYAKAADALNAVRQTGYGVMVPGKDEITMNDPEIIRQGNRYGVKIRAQAPSIHLLRADVVTEVAPIVGSEEQAKDLISYIKKNEDTREGASGTLIFGKSLEQLIDEGLQSRLSSVNEGCQAKLQNAMERIVNESKGRILIILM